MTHLAHLASTQQYLPPPRPPRVVGVEDLVTLSTGGSGTVYRGYQPRFDRWVAVKVLDRQRSDPARLARFERECALLGRLTAHPGVLRVHDCGYLDNGDPYLVTELCAPGSLADRLKDRRVFSREEVLEVGRRIGAVLAAMHADGVLHRDVKPSNIMLREGEGAVLGDFGQAIRLGDADPSPLATAGCAAPEVLAQGAWSPAADVYSLGATMAMLFGEQRPRADTPRPDFPDAAGQLLTAMLSADPGARPPAERVVGTLEALAPGGPPPSRPEADPWWAGAVVTAGEPADSLTELRVPVPGRRRPGRGVLIVGAVAAALLVGAGVAAAVPSRGARPVSAAAAVPPGPTSAPASTSALASGPASASGATPGRPVHGASLAARSTVAAAPPAARSTSAPRSTATARSSSAGSSTAGSSAAASPTATGRGNTPMSAATGAPRVPPGYRSVVSSEGLSAAVPAHWTLKPVSGTNEWRAADPRHPARFLQFGGYRPGHASQLGRVRGYAAAQGAGYRAIRLKPVSHGTASEAVDWEYTYQAGGAAQHARGLYWRRGTAEYVVYVSAPEADWDSVQPAFAVLVGSTEPE